MLETKPILLTRHFFRRWAERVLEAEDINQAKMMSKDVINEIEKVIFNKEEELMTEVQFRKGMDKISELKAEVLVSSVDGDYLKLPKELAKRLKGKYIELIPEEDRIVVIPK